MQKLLATAAMVAGAATASADISTMVFEVVASNAIGQGSYTFMVDVDTATSGGDYDWTIDEDISLTNASGDEVALLQGGSISVIADPVISVGFTVFASQQQTSFQINSTLLSFPTISASAALAQASAGVVLNDLGNDGVTFTPNAGGAYNAYFNNGSSLFTSLFNSQISTGPGGGSFNEDTGAFVSPGFAVDSISASWDFSLSTGDLAVGTSTFTVVPTPASVSLLALGGLAASRRRR